MVTGTIRYWAAARAAAGTAEEPYAGTTLGEVVAVAGERHGADLVRVLSACSFLVSGVRAAAETRLAEGDVIDVLPPFAGG